MRASDYQSEQDQIRNGAFLRQKNELQSNNCCYFVGVVLLTAFVLGYHNETCSEADIRLWLVVALGFMIAFFIIGLVAYNVFV